MGIPLQEILRQHRQALEAATQALLDKETLFGADLEAFLDEHPPQPTTELEGQVRFALVLLVVIFPGTLVLSTVALVDRCCLWSRGRSRTPRGTLHTRGMWRLSEEAAHEQRLTRAVHGWERPSLMLIVLTCELPGLSGYVICEASILLRR